MSGRPSYAQLEALVEFLEHNPGIAKGLLRTTQAKLETKRKWGSLAIELNALGGAIKDGAGWAKYWSEKKCALKKLSAQMLASTRRTGGGPVDNITLSALENRLVAVMGGHQFASGDNTLAVNPFPNSVPAPESPIIEPNIAIVDQNSPIHMTAENIQESQVVTSPVGHCETSQSRRRRHSLPRDDVERFARIEEQRVTAETTTSQALAAAAEAFKTNVEAMQGIKNEMANIANSIMAVANALTLIANYISDKSKS